MAEIKFLKGSLSSWTGKTDVNQDYFYVVNDTASGSISLYLGNKLLANGADASDISKEIADRIAADQVLSKSIEDLETSLTSKIADEIAAVVNGAPENFDTLKEIADYIASDTTNAAKMKNDIAANSSAITAEINRATAAEQANANAIAAEESRAKGIEANLSSAIETEKSRAEAEEASLLSAINDEIIRAQAKEEELTRLIAAEELRAKGAENVLQQQIADELNARADADNNLQGLIETEIQRASNAEQVLQDKIDILSGSSHSHDNKDVLDGITSEKVDEWNASEQNAKTYADEQDVKVLNSAKEYVDAQDEITLNSAKTYADGLASNYDAAGSAAQALVDAKAYVDENKLTAAEDSNVVITDKSIGLQWGSF